jgi:hypothetical protein
MLTYSSLSGALAAERERELARKARTAWERRQRGELKLRAATDDDAPALLHLARRDPSRPPAGRILVAEDDGAIVAAASLDDGALIADPEHASVSTIALLRLRVSAHSELAPPTERRRRFSLRRLRPAAGSA